MCTVAINKGNGKGVTTTTKNSKHILGNTKKAGEIRLSYWLQRQNVDSLGLNREMRV